jgi:hypothetical protein
VAVVSRKTDGDNVSVPGRKLIDDLPGLVAGAVIDENQFEFQAAQGLCCESHPAMEFAQTLFFVVTRHNDRQEHSPGARYLVVAYFRHFNRQQNNGPIQFVPIFGELWLIV